LLLDTIRGMKNIEHFKKYIPGENAVYSISEDAQEIKSNIPLSPSEQNIYSSIDGQKTVGEIITGTGLDPGEIYKIMYLLLCFGLIAQGEEKGEKEADSGDFAETINLHLDLLRIIEANFRKEVGKEFENIFNRCKGELSGQSKELFHDLSLSKDSQEEFTEEIFRRLAKQGESSEGKLFLQSSFNKLVFLLITNMKKILGVGLTENTLEEMMNILEYVEKYRQDTEMMDYVRGNLLDFLRQVQS